MPITLLHLGLLAPFIRHKRFYAALVAFTIVNLWIDFNAIHAVLTGGNFPPHTELSHTLDGALFLGLLVALPGALPYVRSAAWVAGALLGAVSHVLLDALVHQDMHLFGHGIPGELYNPLYLDAMTHVSFLLVIPTILVIGRSVLDGLAVTRRLLGVVQRLISRRQSRAS